MTVAELVALKRRQWRWTLWSAATGIVAIVITRFVDTSFANAMSLMAFAYCVGRADSFRSRAAEIADGKGR